MKKFYSILLITIACFFVSCGGDEDMPNLPPSEVISLNAITKENTIVTISWGEAVDPNGDPVYYDVIVNDRSVATKTTNTFVEVDVAQFLNNLKGASSLELKKGINIDLIIKIQAYDDANNVSNEVEFLRSVFVNREPKNLEFDTIYFDTYDYSYIDIVWSPATDDDGDILSYDIFLNDILINSNFVIGSDSYDGLGRVSYYENFFNLVKEEIIIKVIAKDGSGGSNEITQSFNFTATDVDLGILSVPSENQYSVSINSDEPDNRIGYSFSINETTGLAIIDSDNNTRYRLRDSNGNSIYEGNRINIESLESGSYYFEIEKYNDSYKGSFTIILRDPTSTDQDLGIIETLPYSNDVSFNDLNAEPDNKIRYKVEMNVEGAYSFETSSNVNMNFLDVNGNYLSNGYNSLSGTIISTGIYYIEVYANNYSSTSGTLNISMQEIVTPIVELDLISPPYSEIFSYDNTNSSNGRTTFNFNVDTDVNYTFEITNANHDTYLYLYNASGNLINANDDGGNGALSKMTGNLSTGSYYIQTAGFGGSLGSGTLSVSIQ